MITDNLKTMLNLRDQLNDCGKRLTKQRLIILNYLRQVTSHPTAQTIYAQVRKQIPNISLGTVYRNLKFLVDHHYIIQLHTEDDKTHYDGNNGDHIHFICERCGQIMDIMDTNYLNRQKLKKYGTPHISICKVYGVCHQCK